MAFAKIIKASGQVLNATPKNGTDFSIEELQAIVGGYIEIVYDAERNLLVVDEEGKVKGKQPNLMATAAYGNPYDQIVGDVLYCSPCYIK